MTKEKSLSEKVFDFQSSFKKAFMGVKPERAVYVKDVAEAVKKLKKRQIGYKKEMSRNNNPFEESIYEGFIEEIDEIFGEELTQEAKKK